MKANRPATTNVAALWVAVGSGLGGVARVATAAWMTSMFGTHFPVGVLTVNVLGSIAIGLAATLTAPDGRLFAGAAARRFFMAGFCGGFTTFSFFSLETMELIEDGRVAVALLYSGLTLFLAMLAVLLGHLAGLRISRPAREPNRKRR